MSQKLCLMEIQHCILQNCWQHKDNLNPTVPLCHPWVSKIPWRMQWQPTPGFLPGKPHRQKSLRSYVYEVSKSQIWQALNNNSYYYQVYELSCFNHVQLFVTHWTAACQAPLSMGFSRQEYWSGLPCPPPGDIPDPVIEPTSLMSPALVGRFFTTRYCKEITIEFSLLNIGIGLFSILLLSWKSFLSLSILIFSISPKHFHLTHYIFLPSSGV